MTSDDGDYWSIDILGLTQVEAEALVNHAKSQNMGSMPGWTIDPVVWFRRYMDPSTVQILVRALEYAKAATTGPFEGDSVLEDMSDWLDRYPRG